jgi:hypothetical protein
VKIVKYMNVVSEKLLANAATTILCGNEELHEYPRAE